jgi:hypothetical protein
LLVDLLLVGVVLVLLVRVFSLPTTDERPPAAPDAVAHAGTARLCDSLREQGLCAYMPRSGGVAVDIGGVWWRLTIDRLPADEAPAEPTDDDRKEASCPSSR